LVDGLEKSEEVEHHAQQFPLQFSMAVFSNAAFWQKPLPSTSKTDSSLEDKVAKIGKNLRQIQESLHNAVNSIQTLEGSKQASYQLIRD